MEKLYKGFDLNFKDIDSKKGIVTGYFAAFNSKDSHGDVIEKGAFSKTVAERGPNGKQLIKWLLDHESNKAIGKLIDLKEDDYGLYYEGKVGRHSLGKDFMLMVEDGIINQHSFGYSVIKETFDKSMNVNRLKELRMYEGSSIQFLGSNPNTPITGIKSIEDALSMCARLEKFIHKSDASDQTLINLEKELISLQKALEPLIHSKDKKPIIEIKNELLNLF